MSEPRRPAWAKDSVVLRLGTPVTLEDLSPEWAFGGATGRGVRVAVVDSGIDADHPMLGESVDADSAIDFAVSAEGTIVASEGPHGDVFGHGTACAGIIHALAPDARITSVRVLGPGLSGKAAAFHAGLSWAVEQGFDIINLSLGTSKKDWALAFHEVCDRAYFGNTFIVTAANNVARVSYPSLFASVASVACNTSSDPLRFHANPEPPTEFLARGIDVEVPWLNGGTTRTTGNSFAAPHIAGLAALVKSKHPQLRPYQIKTALWATSANVREASEIEVAGRRGTVMATGARSTNYRPTSVRAATRSETVTGPPTVGVVRVDDPPFGDRAPVRDLLAEAVPDVVLTDDTGERGPEGAFRVGSRRDTGETVLVRDLSGLGANAIAVALPMIRRIAGIRHPHLEVILSVAADPVAAVVTPRRAPSVDERLGAGPDPSLAWRLSVLIAACAGVAALHDGGLVHGDLRPTDLGIDEAGGLVILGAVRASVATSSARFSGGRSLSVSTMRYLAREQFEDGPVTAATDVHALALHGCRLLTGRLPYPDVDRVADLLRQRIGRPPAPTATLGGSFGAMSAVLDQALDPSPDRRHPTAGMLASAVARAALGLVVAEDLRAAGPLRADVLDAIIEAAPPRADEAPADGEPAAADPAGSRWWRRPRD